MKYLTSILVAALMLLSTMSFASDLQATYTMNDPVYSALAFTADTADPVVAMAGGDYDSDKDKPCMAGCLSAERTPIAANFYKVTDNLKSRTVLACGYSAIPKDRPYKIPILI